MIDYISQYQLKFTEFNEINHLKLDFNNRWIQLGAHLPWDNLVKIYSKQFDNNLGAKAVNPRIIIGAFIIKHKLNLSDQEVLITISENPYMQFFLGLGEFYSALLFSPTLFVELRKKLGKPCFDSFSEGLTASLAVAGDVMNSITNIAGEFSQARIDAIDEEIDKNNEHYDTAINNAKDQYDEEGNLLESSDRRKEILEAEKQAKEKELKKKELKEKRKQAIFNKVLAVAQIGFDLANTISKINLAAVAIDAISFGLGGTPYRAANIPLAIASSALQVGSILATPLPKYKQGRKGGKAEWAITGDGGVNEFVEKKDGSIYKTPNKDTLTYLEKDDIVHKDYNALKIAKGLSEDTFNQLYRTVAGANLQSKYDRASDVQQKITINNRINEQFIVNAIRENNTRIDKQIKNGFKNITINSRPTINIPTNYQKG